MENELEKKREFVNENSTGVFPVEFYSYSAMVETVIIVSGFNCYSQSEKEAGQTYFDQSRQ